MPEDHTFAAPAETVALPSAEQTPAPALQTEAPVLPTDAPVLPAVEPLDADDVVVDMLFSDGGSVTGAQPQRATAQAVSLSPTQAAMPDPTPALPEITQAPASPEEEGVWTYETDAMQVRIERKEQDDFVYFAADIQLTSPAQFSYAFANEKYGSATEALSDIAARHSPLLAINGDYYNFHTNGIIIRGGELFRKNKSARHLLIVDSQGDLSVMTDRSEKQGLVANRLVEEGALHTFEFGPVLVEEGEAVKLNSAILRVGEGYLEPRTAIGQYGPLHYLVLVVDGRSDGYSAGCDLPTLQQLFLDHGVTTAFNLDGGGSTTLWFDGEVINHPASGDERKVSDIIMFMREP